MAAITCTLTCWGIDEPTGVTSLFCSTRNSLGCNSSGISPTSSRKTMPPSAARNTPKLRPAAPVNAPFSWPNNWLSASVGVSAAQLTGHKGLIAARAQAMQQAGPELFAGTGFAGHQDGTLDFGGAFDVARNPIDFGTAAEDPAFRIFRCESQQRFN